MDKEALYYKLEDYLNGKLPEKEHEDLKNRIAADEQVAEQLALVRLERELAGLMADDELEAKMKQWTEEAATRHQEEENGWGKENSNGQSRNRWLLGLLLAILALVAGYWLMSVGDVPTGSFEETTIQETPTELLIPDEEPPAEDTDASNQHPQEEPLVEEDPSPPSSSKAPPIAAEKPVQQKNVQQLALAAAASTSPIGRMSTRGKSNPATGAEESPLDKGFRLMGEGDLDEAQQVLETISPQPRGLYLNAQQYLAYIYFEQKDYNAAIPALEELIKIDYIDEDKMKWYLALAYLSTGQTAKGLPLAREVAENNKENELQQAAAALLGKLEGE